MILENEKNLREHQVERDPPFYTMLASSLLMTSVTQAGFLADLPAAFKSSPSNWAYLTYPNIAVLPGAFNRSAMNAIVESETSDEQLSATYV